MSPADDERRSYPAEKARGGRIILRSRTRRMIFLAGLIGAIVLAILLGIAATWWH
jgi:hypothetical protein